MDVKITGTARAVAVDKINPNTKTGAKVLVLVTDAVARNVGAGMVFTVTGLDKATATSLRGTFVKARDELTAKDKRTPAERGEIIGLGKAIAALDAALGPQETASTDDAVEIVEVTPDPVALAALDAEDIDVDDSVLDTPNRANGGE